MSYGRWIGLQNSAVRLLPALVLRAALLRGDGAGVVLGQNQWPDGQGQPSVAKRLLVGSAGDQGGLFLPPTRNYAVRTRFG